MDRISRSFALVGQSFRLLLHDKELMLLPVVSGLLLVLVTASFFVGMGFHRGHVPADESEWLFPAFLFYVVTYAVGIFFQGAVVAGATQRMRGENPTLGSALRAPLRRLPSILLWAVIAATVGMLLRSLQERSGFLGRLVISLVGAAWSLATFFIVPAIVVDELSVSEGLSHSADVFKRTWGETLAGSVGLGLAAVVVWLLFAACIAAIVAVGPVWLAIGVGAAGGVTLLALFATLEGIYVASLYRYATDGQVPTGFHIGDFRHTFVRRRTL